MKVMLVQPSLPYAVSDSYRTDGLGIAYLAAVLRQEGHEVALLDAYLRGLSLRDTIEEILSNRFDILGLTAADVHRTAVVQIIKAVRSARPEATICAGGYLPSLAYDRLLKACPGLDFIVRGEGETVAVDVFGRIASGRDWHDAPGVAYRDGESIVANPAPQLIKDLDILPFPARDALESSSFGMDSAGVISGRGCYHSCSFCCLRVMNQINHSRVPRFRSPENVVAEIEQVSRNLGITDIRFVDDDFIGPGRKTRERALEIARLIKGLNLGITFRIECRADEVDEDILKPLKEAGLNHVYLGVESGVQRALDTFNKRLTVEQNKKAIELVRSLDIDLRCGFIMFDPYTTVEEIQENVAFARETGMDKDAANSTFALITALNIFHGTPLEEKLRQDGLLIDKDFDLRYRFKQPIAGMLFKTAIACSTCSSLIKTVKSMCGIKEKADCREG
jgi:anaerobic magnesium-protoporphyrin IX monomethyl ester cyclase